MGGFRRLALGLCLVVTTGSALAATEAEKRAAIDKGLQWLAQQQQADGRWNYGGNEEDTAATGAALLAFLEENWKAGDDVVLNGVHYGDVVGRAFGYVLGQASVVSISNQTAGNPDGDGNHVGVRFVPGATNGRDTYVLGLVLPALARCGTPSTVVTTGAFAGRTDGTGPGGAWTYKDVVQNTVDYAAFGQADSGSARGGWRYYANYGSSDNSTAQWPPIGMLFATDMGVTAPAFVKDELAYWIGYIQNMTPGSSYGGSGYDSPTYLVNESKTGGLLVEMKFAGDNTSGVAYDLSNTNVQAALTYLNNNWLQTANSTWDGNFGHPYAMWSIYKGLETTIGLTDTTYITNLRSQAAQRGGTGALLDPGDTWNWWQDYCEYLWGTQAANGSWGGYSSWTGVLATAWNINILNATLVPGTTVPLPRTALAGLGLLAGIAAFRKLRRRKD